MVPREINRKARRQLGKTSPEAASANLNRGFARHQAGDIRGAELLYRQALAAEPNNPEAMRLLGEALIDTGKYAEAIALLSRLARLLPEHFVTHYTLGNAYRLAGQTAAAISCYQAAITRNPGFAGAHHGLGAALQRAGRDAEAADSFAAAAKAEPRWAVAWNDLGMNLAALGKLGLAAAALERALTLDPNLAEARRHLLAIRETATPSDITALQSTLLNQNVPEAAKVETGFALGKLLDKTERYDEAFGAFAQANQRLRAIQEKAGFRFDRARLTADINKLINIFASESFSQWPSGGIDSDLPVFIVGMPRSGTSLVEQIAASHHQVAGAGEIKAIGEIAGKIGWRPSASWSAAAIGVAARRHFDYLSKQGGAAARVIDKMPDNIFQLGLIATLFPQARIIFCERDAMNTCFSCFTQRFAEPLGYDTDLADCGFRYREIQRLTRHWQQVLPLRIFHASYEAMVTNLEQESRRLIDFLGLEWDPACLDFHRTQRVVKTASWAQVRQPAYRHAIGRAKHYAAHLAPLEAALQDAL